MCRCWSTTASTSRPRCCALDRTAPDAIADDNKGRHGEYERVWHDRMDDNRANRAFPLSYALTVLGEIGAADLMFAPRERYAGRSAVQWFVDELSDGGLEEGDRLSMIDHALVSYALRMRGAGAAETPLFRDFRFALAK